MNSSCAQEFRVSLRFRGIPFREGDSCLSAGGFVFVWHVAVFRAMEAAMEERLRMLFNAR